MFEKTKINEKGAWDGPFKKLSPMEDYYLPNAKGLSRGKLNIIAFDV